MLCLAEGGDEYLLAVAGHSEISAVRGRRESDVIFGPEVGVIAVVEVFHAEDVIRLLESDEDFIGNSSTYYNKRLHSRRDFTCLERGNP